MPAAPRCPACEYDLSGIVESWGGVWPLEGVCPECGRRLEWGAVLHPGERPPSWSFEHGERPGLRRALLTLAHLAEPVSFWWAMRHTRSSRPARVALLAAMVAGAGALCATALAAWTVWTLAPSVRMPVSVPSLLADSYGSHSREAVTYLAVWLLGSGAGVAPFARSHRHAPRALASASLYACAVLCALWSALALAAIAGVYQLAAFGVAGGPAEIVAAACILAAWVWLLAMWYGLVRWRLPVRRPVAAWLVSQAAASCAVAGFGLIDAWFLPF